MRRLIAAFIVFISATVAFAGDVKSPEFDGYCAYSLANGGENKTGCEVVWISPEDKLYCFMNETAKSEFVKDAARNIRKARAFWEDPSFWEKLKKQEES